MSARGVTVALGIVSLIPLAACGGADVGLMTPTIAPAGELALRDVTFAEVVQGGFGVQGLTSGGRELQAADGSTYYQLGRLVGDLTSPASPAMAQFIDYRPSGPDGLPEGVYIIFVSLDRENQPQFAAPSVLSSSGGSILPVTQATEVSPFQQGEGSLDGVSSVSPALVLDLEGDGLDEMALLVRTQKTGVSFEHYDVYQRDGGGDRWRRVGGEGTVSAPGQGALEYWASVGAAVNISSRWDREDRLLTVWPWLAQEDAPVAREVVQGLVPDGDPEEVAAAQEALIFLRTFFDEAHQRFSEGFQIRQPWPGFINGFKSTEAVELLSVSPPVFGGEGAATVEVLMELTEREGDDPVVRLFLVNTEMVSEGAEWYLNDVSAAEQREP